MQQTGVHMDASEVPVSTLSSLLDSLLGPLAPHLPSLLGLSALVAMGR